MSKKNETKTKASKEQNTKPDGYRLLYAVLKLNQDITYIDPFTKEERKQKIQGIAGYIPCFETIEEAEEHACDGKFQIFPIQAEH